MEKEKQIDEMAKLICTFPQCVNYNIIGGCKIAECQTVDIAENLYKQGYRKVEQGEWKSELVKKCDWKGKQHQYFQPNSCSKCHEPVAIRTPYCPHCGAKMRGE